MDKDKTTIRIWKNTQRELKLLAERCGIPMTQVLDRLVSEEIERRKK